jgi:hypothetical protein
MYGTGRGVTTENFFKNCEPENILVTRNVTMVDTLRENEPEIPALFLSGTQREVCSSTVDSTKEPNNGIICTRNKQGCQPPFFTVS